MMHSLRVYVCQRCGLGILSTFGPDAGTSDQMVMECGHCEHPQVFELRGWLELLTVEELQRFQGGRLQPPAHKELLEDIGRLEKEINEAFARIRQRADHAKED